MGGKCYFFFFAGFFFAAFFAGFLVAMYSSFAVSQPHPVGLWKSQPKIYGLHYSRVKQNRSFFEKFFLTVIVPFWQASKLV